MKRIPNHPKPTTITLADRDGDIFKLVRDDSDKYINIFCNDRVITVYTADVRKFTKAMRELAQ